MDTRIFWRECRSLSKAGYEVYIVAHDVPSEACEGVQFVDLPPQFTRRALLTRPDRAAGFFAKLNGDVYHFHDPDLLPVAGLMGRKEQIVIYDCHEWYYESFPYKGYPQIITKVVRLGYRLVERNTIHNLSAIITPSEELATVYKDRAKLVVPLRNFAPIDLFTGGIPDRERQEYDLIHVGVLSRPRLSFMLDVIREVHRRGRQLTLLLLGVSLELRAWIDEQSDVAAYVTSLDRVPVDQVPTIMHSARIGLNYHPYQTRLMVAIPIKVFEYMGCGLPFVSSALPPLKSILGDKGAGILVESNEIEAFADAILALLDNRQLRAKMGKRGRECVEQMYNWEAESAKLVELYEMLLCRTR